MKYNYYSEELKKINPKSRTLSLKLNDFEGNSTKHLGVNKESLPKIIKLITKFVENQEKAAKAPKKYHYALQIPLGAIHVYLSKKYDAFKDEETIIDLALQTDQISHKDSKSVTEVQYIGRTNTTKK